MAGAPSPGPPGGTDGRMRVLSILSSSNQMYSGIGRNVFELASRLGDRVAYEFAIDDATPRNVELVVEFGRAHRFPVYVGRAFREPDALDVGNADLGDLLGRGGWDAIEAVCFANAATNATLLEHPADSILVYTPHDQPTWTVPMDAAQEARTTDVHRRMIRRADLVLCDSPAECESLQALIPDRRTCTHLPLGCDFRHYRPGPVPRHEQILFVGDLAELRKRFDRVLAVLPHLLEVKPTLRLVVIGNRSDSAEIHIPRSLRHAVTLRGYVPEAELRRAYSECLGLILLSDFEAFGIPILEALASGTPVFLSEQAETRSLFGDYAGAHFCPADSVEGTVEVLCDVLARGPWATADAICDVPRLRSIFDWDGLSDRKWRLLSAAWSRRNAFAIPA